MCVLYRYSYPELPDSGFFAEFMNFASIFGKNDRITSFLSFPSNVVKVL